MPEQLDIALSFKPASAARRVGLVVLSSDHTTELEFSRLVSPRGVEVFTARVEYANPTTPENLRAMTPHIKTAAASILSGTRLDVIYYSCTAGSVHIGNEAIINSIHAAKRVNKVITPSTAAVAAFKILGIEKLALLTPYMLETSQPLEPYFEREAGVEIVRHSCLGLADDCEMARLDSKTLIKAAEMADHHDADGLFISCTALRAVEIAGDIEKKIGKPVVTSNQAAIWNCLRLIGFDGPEPTDNELFCKH